jgi:3-(3-hydroxy-phenyl)propionate hydroxylase
VLHGDVDGAAADALLDSYGHERKAHVRELTSRIKGVGAVICERDPARARARDAKLLADCGGSVKDTPRQDILPRLETGFLAMQETTGRGTLFPQPRLASSGALMDHAVGGGWRLVFATDAQIPGDVPAGITVVALARTPEADGVVARWMQAHGCCAALLRPDHYVFGTARSATETTQLLAEWQQRWTQGLAQREAALA